ncbi:MAG: hypothetical protein C0616_08255 [Desulfuromonas sp.]|nr:MAG: hypothetical protein C0616_08255 [Desulfuromonas sp.]
MRYSICIGITLILISMLSAVTALADEAAYLHVSGEAELLVPADQAELRIGVQSDGSTADAALDANSRVMKKVEESLQRVGLEKGDYSTARFQLSPRWSPRPRNAPAGWRPQIVGFSVSNSFAVKTGKIELLGKVIEAASDAGANDIGQIVFALADSRAHRQQAIQTATSNAMVDAKTLAAASGVTLRGISDIALGQTAQTPARPLARGVMMSMEANAAPPIVAPDDLTVRASVSIRYLIED